MLKLVGTDGEHFYSWVLEEGKYIIGRNADCDFSIPHKTVSRNHAEIDVSPDGNDCFLVDLDSHNGTLVNGNQIESRVRIRQGDLILFGFAEFRLAAAHGVGSVSDVPTTTKLAQGDLQNSVRLSIAEALQPLPVKVTERPELLPTLFEMAKMLVLPEPREVMLERSLGMISRVIPAQRLAILFVSENRDAVYTAASLLQGEKDPGAFKLSRTIVNEIVTNKNAILICDPKDDPRFAGQQSIIMSGLRSAIAVPLFDEGKVLGILYADTTDPMHVYDNDQLRVLATLGNIIASKLLSYALFAERQEKHVMEAELRRASQIQKALLVTSPPEIPGHEIYAFQEQSRSVGGDLYDMKLLPNGRLLFLVADVSGKGMGAALLMANILACFRILYESRRFDLGRAVERVSMQMFNCSNPEDFATLFIGLVEPDKKQIRFINAGHNPAFMVRADGSYEHLEASGMMIGAFDFATWTEETTELGEGDLLFIYSDGVPEAQRDDDQYGEERTRRLVIAARNESPEGIVSRLMDDINGFMGGAPRSDDITMLVIKRALADK